MRRSLLYGDPLPVMCEWAMIGGLHPVIQSLLGTLLTWGLTAAGAGLVFVFQSGGKVYENRSWFGRVLLTVPTQRFSSVLTAVMHMVPESQGITTEREIASLLWNLLNVSARPLRTNYQCRTWTDRQWSRNVIWYICHLEGQPSHTYTVEPLYCRHT